MTAIHEDLIRDRIDSLRRDALSSRRAHRARRTPSTDYQAAWWMAPATSFGGIGRAKR